MKNYYLLLSMVLLILTVGCSSYMLNEEDVLETKGVGGVGPSGPGGLTNYVDGGVLLGDEIPNIYSVSATRAAYRARYPNGGQYGESAIRTTHYYVRFLPKTEDEFYSIDHYGLSTIPLHKEIQQGGSFYHDPSIPADQYSWQYAVVPVNQLNTTVEYEILDDLFIVDEDSTGASGPSGTGGNSMSYAFWTTLIESSDNITIGGSGQAGPSASWWIPMGRIVAYDDLLDRYIPLENAEIFIWHGTRKTTVRTNSNGEFVSNKSFLAKNIYYRLNWQGDKYVIYDGNGWLDPAFVCNGKKISGAWNVMINQTDYHRKQLSAIFRACERTYNKDYLSLGRPVFWGRIAISYNEGNGPSLGLFRGGLVTSKLFPAIKIWGKSHGSYRTSNDIFGTTIHELAHASHYKRVGFLSFLRVDDEISESWARVVQYYVSKKEYEEYGKDTDIYETLRHPGSKTRAIGPPAPSKRFVVPKELNVQDWPLNVPGLEYSSLMIDLVDDNNQMMYYMSKYPNDNSYLIYPNDNVKNFELSRIYDALYGAEDVGSFKTAMKNLNTQYYSSINTNVEIDSLFKRYEQRWK